MELTVQGCGSEEVQTMTLLTRVRWLAHCTGMNAAGAWFITCRITGLDLGCIESRCLRSTLLYSLTKLRDDEDVFTLQVPLGL